jgi:tetratricopeptide (TPR) repeat protein
MAPERPRFKVTAQGITWTLLIMWSFFILYASDHIAGAKRQMVSTCASLDGLHKASIQQEEETRKNKANLDQLIATGDTSFSEGHFDEALGFYEHAMRLAPGDFDTFYSVMRTRAVIAAYHPQRITSASATELVVAARIAERRDPDSRDFYLAAIGNIELFGRDNLAAAERSFRSALEHSPANAIAKTGLGCLLATQEGKRAEARRYLVEGLESYPRHAYGQLALARDLLSSGEGVAASEHAFLAEKLRSTPTTLLIAARAAYLAQNSARALAYAKRLMRAAPDQPAAPRIIGMLAGQAGKLPAATTNLRKAYALSGDPNDLLAAATFFEQQDRWEEATRLIEEARSHARPDIHILLRHATALSRTRHYKDAIRAFEDALALIDAVPAEKQTDELRAARAQVVESLTQTRDDAVEHIRSR